MITTFLALLIVLGAFLVAFATLALVGSLTGPRNSRLRSLSGLERGTITFLFENERLLDATPPARDLLASGPRGGNDWSRLAAMLEPRFPRLNDWVSELAEIGEMERLSEDGTSILHAEWHDGVARLSLASAAGTLGPAALDPHATAAMTRELEVLRTATDTLPHPMWLEDEAGRVSWCNATYLDLVEAIDGADDNRSWPPRKLFDTSVTGSARCAIDGPDAETRRWFDLEMQSFGTGRLVTATAADALVRAEATLGEFVTTLSKTFAELPVGLAIFSRSRELAMFNPALLDLTMLPVDFLLSKPTLASFLDRLREQQMMPEPRDYKSWRQQVADLVSRARDGTYVESWTLPGGQTYRVTGKPQPDGAVAFLFEDISAEVTLARRFRADIEMGQGALDAMPVALAVFSTAGVMTLANRAYTALWNRGPDEDNSIFDAIGTWREAAAPTPIWEDLRRFAAHSGARDPWAAQLMLKDGRPLQCRVAPLPQGCTLVEFSLVEARAVEELERPKQEFSADPPQLAASR